MIHLPAIAFLAYAGASLAWSPGDVPWAAALLGSLAGAYALGALIADPRWIWFGYCALMALNVPIAIAFKALDISTLSGIQGLFGNPNYLASALALGIAGALSYRLWWYLPFGISGLWLCQSRGAMLAAGLLGLIFLWPKYKATAMIAALLAILAALNFTEIKSTYEASAVMQRLGVWQETLNHLTILGSGFGAFQAAYSSWPIHINMTMLIAPHAYNDVLEMIFDLGIGASFLWLVIIQACEARGPKLPLAGFLLLSLTFFPLFVPLVGQLFALTLGNLTRRLEHGSMEVDRKALPQRSWC